MTVQRSADRKSHGGAVCAVPQVRLHLLGGFRASRDEQDIPAELWDRRTAARVLVKVLATAPSHHMHREQMMEILCPGLDQSLSLNHLGKALHAARQILEPNRPTRMVSSYLTLDEDMLSLHRHNVWIDLDEFKDRAQSALATGTVAGLQAAIAVYTGEVLPGDCYADWATSSRETAAELYLDLLIALAEAHSRAGEYSRAITLLREVLTIDAASEETHRSLMRLYARHGERNRALRQYQQLTRILQRELGVAPDGTTQALYAAIKEGRFPPVPVSPDRDTSLLPVPTGNGPRSPFIGRGTVLRELTGMLEASVAGRGGIVLLKGGPGIGKSRIIDELGKSSAGRGVRVLGSMPSFATSRDTEDWAHELAARQAEIVNCLSDAPGREALLVLLDDLHVADTPTLQALGTVARQVTNRSWLIVGTYGTGERIDLHFKDLTDLIQQIPAGRVTTLQPLSREASGVMLKLQLPDAEVPDTLIDRFHAFTLGNPLFLEELVRTMLDGRQLQRRGGVWVAYPATFRIPVRIQTLITERVDRLGEDAAAVLALLSLIGTDVPLSFLQRVDYLRESCLADALGRAVEAGLLKKQEDCYVFPYPLLRVAISAGVSPQRRPHLHGLIAQAIERYHPDDLAALGYHRGRAGLTVDRLGTFNFAV